MFSSKFSIFLCYFATIRNSLSDDVPTPHLCLPPPSEKCFTVIVDQKLNWNDAEKFCERNLTNGRLAAIHNAFDGSLINGWLSFLSSDAWIGAIQIGGLPYQWTDSSPFDYQNWTPGEPTNPCAQICYKTQTDAGVQCQQGKWRTADCETATAQIICEYGNFSATATTTSTATTSPGPTDVTDCYDLYNKYDIRQSGIYSIFPPGLGKTDVYCEMDTDGGGWTVFQRRNDDSLSFYDKNWNQYKYGFNNGLNNNLWLGNEIIHVISKKDSNVELRIDLWGDTWPNSSNPNIYLYEKKTFFFIDSESNFYALHVAVTSSGNASVSGGPYGINYNYEQHFSTIDADHSPDKRNCSGRPDMQLGGWWFFGCTYVSLNGKYVPPRWHEWESGLLWYSEDYLINPARTRMMLRKYSS